MVLTSFLRLVTVWVIFGLVFCQNARAEPSPATPPGKIWDTSASRFITEQDFMQRLMSAHFILAGETHDDPTHHQIQAHILHKLIAGGRRPALVMEQYDLAQQGQIQSVLTDKLSPEKKTDRLLNLMSAAWDPDAYRPVVHVGVQAALPVIAANFSRDSARSVARDGFVAMGKEKVAELKLEEVWSPDREQRTAEAIQDGHCGMLPQRAVPGMVKAQRARDAVMADSLLRHGTDGAVAIFGRGHVLKDSAVPLYLGARSRDAVTIAIGLMETDQPTELPESTRASLAAQYDYVWFTPAVSRQGDPCAAFAPPGAGTQPTEKR